MAFCHILYINDVVGCLSLKTFEKPLSVEEEKYYLEKYKEGNLDAKNVLIEKNMRLVAHMVKKYATSDRDVEDLLSVGTIGLIKAVNTFNVNKSCRLATYAAKCIDNELLMMLRNEKRKSKEVSIYEPIGTDKEGNEISLIEVVKVEGKDVVEDYSNREDIYKAYRAINDELSDREREIIVERYGLFGHEEKTQRELAVRMNISRSYVSRIEKRALEKLRAEFDKR